MKGKAKPASVSAEARKLSTPCWFVLVVGLPGSGKSHLSKPLESKGWVRVSQDDLGSQDEVRKLIAKSLKHRRSVLLDRCNVHPKERKMWLQEVRPYPNVTVEAVFLNTPIDECKRRVVERTGHPNLQGPGAASVVDDFLRGFEVPAEREGFASVHVARTLDESREVLRLLSSYPVSAKDL
eukprot:m51a1_g714 putative p-loop containing nucleoside triphosphate hydrolase protein (181) ;mRNA; f:421967-422776